MDSSFSGPVLVTHTAPARPPPSSLAFSTADVRVDELGFPGPSQAHLDSSPSAAGGSSCHGKATADRQLLAAAAGTTGREKHSPRRRRGPYKVPALLGDRQPRTLRHKGLPSQGPAAPEAASVGGAGTARAHRVWPCAVLPEVPLTIGSHRGFSTSLSSPDLPPVPSRAGTRV